MIALFILCTLMTCLRLYPLRHWAMGDSHLYRPCSESSFRPSPISSMQQYMSDIVRCSGHHSTQNSHNIQIKIWKLEAIKGEKGNRDGKVCCVCMCVCVSLCVSSHVHYFRMDTQESWELNGHQRKWRSELCEWLESESSGWGSRKSQTPVVQAHWCH